MSLKSLKLKLLLILIINYNYGADRMENGAMFEGFQD